MQLGAATLDWNSVNWTAGSLSQSFDIDPSNPGNDITITLTGDTGGLILGSPDDTTDITGGFGAGNESLFLAANHAADYDNITVTIQFTGYTYGVTNVAFTIMDVDYQSGNWRDVIYNFDGTYGGSSVSTPTLTGSTANTVGTAGAGPYLYGLSSAAENTTAGDGSVSFGSTPVDTVRFTWYNWGLNGQQWIAISDITYNVAVPEPSTYIAGCLLLLCAAWQLRRRALAAGRAD